MDLEEVLAGMPLRVWRTDAVTPLAPHPNDPGRSEVALDPLSGEFLTWFEVSVPPATDGPAESAVRFQEARRTAELSAEGRLVRLWRLPGSDRDLGHWQARSDDDIAGLLSSLPMFDWLTIQTSALGRHPNDPGFAARSDPDGGHVARSRDAASTS